MIQEPVKSLPLANGDFALAHTALDIFGAAKQLNTSVAELMKLRMAGTGPEFYFCQFGTMQYRLSDLHEWKKESGQ